MDIGHILTAYGIPAVSFYMREMERGLHPGYTDGVRPLIGFRNFEADLLALLQFLEINADEEVRMEEQVVLHAFALDESGAALREFYDGSVLHESVGR